MAANPLRVRSHRMTGLPTETAWVHTLSPSMAIDRAYGSIHLKFDTDASTQACGNVDENSHSNSWLPIVRARDVMVAANVGRSVLATARRRDRKRCRLRQDPKWIPESRLCWPYPGFARATTASSSCS
jgi:hypothetical protein